MSVRYEIKKECGYVLVIANGDVTVEQLARLIHERVSEDGHDPSLKMLCDFREIENLRLGITDLRKLLDMERSVTFFRRGTRVAVVTGSDIVFGMARMYELLAYDLPQDMSVYRDMDAARQWLEID